MRIIAGPLQLAEDFIPKGQFAVVNIIPGTDIIANHAGCAFPSVPAALSFMCAVQAPPNRWPRA